MSNLSKPIILTGDRCQLVPLSYEHEEELSVAVADGKLDGLWYTFAPKPQEMKNNISMRLALQKEGSMLPFTVLDKPLGKAVGMTTFLNIDHENCRVEIGGTWYRKQAQRTGLNTECKLLMLSHAFESLNCIAVEFRTHAFNVASRRGIERLGAKLDGVLRNHMVMPNGTLRDTYVYSIISSEWPTVKAHLNYLKSKYLSDTDNFEG